MEEKNVGDKSSNPTPDESVQPEYYRDALPVSTAPPPPPAIKKQDVAALKAEFAVNRKKRREALIIVLIVAAVALIGLGLLVQEGLGYTTYREAQRAADNASVFGWLLAGLSGFMLAYFMAHPTNHPQVTGKAQFNPLVIFFIVGGLFLGVIPGLVILLIYSLGLRNTKKSFEHNPDQPLAFKRAGNVGLVFAFLVGMIPGAVLYYIISYPLSQHACKLSGSKYC